GDDFGTVPVDRGVAEEVKAVADHDLKVTLPKDNVDKVQVKVEELPSSLTAPVEKGQPLGKVVFIVGGDKIAEVPLVAADEVLCPPVRWWMWLGLLLVVLWLITEIIIWDIRRRRRRMRLKRIAFRYRDPR
ncbi:MAG: hypothetical protein ACOYEO_08340, partial [bacterium]